MGLTTTSIVSRWIGSAKSIANAVLSIVFMAISTIEVEQRPFLYWCPCLNCPELHWTSEVHDAVLSSVLMAISTIEVEQQEELTATLGGDNTAILTFQCDRQGPATKQKYERAISF